MSERGRAARFARVVAVIAVLGALIPWSGARAHQRHAAPDTVTSVTASPKPVGDTSEPAGESPVGKAKPHPYAMPPLGDALLEHVHNKVVHFPIALAAVALLLLLLDRMRPGSGAGGRILIWLAAAGAVVAYFSGRAQMEAFRGTEKEWLVGVHESWGTAAALALVAWPLLSLWRPARRRIWIAGFLVVCVVLTAAFLGGLVAHGE